MTNQQIKIRHNNQDYCNDDGLIEWYKGYQKRKTQKAQIKKELKPTAWQPARLLLLPPTFDSLINLCQFRGVI